MNSLDFKKDEFEELLKRSCDIILNRFEGLENAKAYSGLNPGKLRTCSMSHCPKMVLTRMIC